MNSPLPPLRSETPAVGPDGFLKVVQQALALHIQESELDSHYAPILVEDYPKDRTGKFDHQFLVVLFNVASARMGATDPAGTRRPTGPALREDRPSASRARYRTRTYGWWEDTIVQFRLLGKSNESANRLTEWFHRFMMRYGCTMQYFRAHGVQRFLFDSRLEDRLSNEFQQELYERRLQYYVRLEYLDVFEAKTLEDIDVSVSLDSRSSAETTTFTFDQHLLTVKEPHNPYGALPQP